MSGPGRAGRAGRPPSPSHPAAGGAGGRAVTSTSAAQYANALLRSLGQPDRVDVQTDPVADWASCGAMALTGPQRGAPLAVAGPTVVLRGVLAALGALSGDVALPGVGLLGERAAYLGLQRRGGRSCGGATRLLPATDATLAVSLARPDDLALVPAWLERPEAEPWRAVARWLRDTPGAAARDRAVLLGLPVSMVGEVRATRPWSVRPAPSTSTHPSAGGRPRVVDLSALWAGPLAASLLGMCGCEVVKVEDVRRPDGARAGDPDFFRLLRGPATQVTLDVRSARGRDRLRDLLTGADIVIEGSRARALAQWGLSAQWRIASGRAVTWISITGYGRDCDRVAFGDDAAAAGGLVADGCFVGDAVADPLTGVHAALAGLAGLARGGSRLVDIPLARVAAVAASYRTPRSAVVSRRSGGGWQVQTAGGPVPVAPPAVRPGAATADPGPAAVPDSGLGA